MTPDLQHALSRYVDGGWVDVSRDRRPPNKGDRSHPAYLILASNMVVWPGAEVQVTSRSWWPFRAHKMIVAEGSASFDLVDLMIGNRSQLSRAENVPLREYVGFVCGRREEVQPSSIRWPLDVCTYGGDAIVRAILPGEGPPAEFEIVLLGEAV